MKRRAFIIAVMLIGLAPSVPVEAGHGYCNTSEERAFLVLINAYRVANGVPRLTITQTLGDAARHHSKSMAARDYFSHTLWNGITWSQNMSNHGYTFATNRGENIAAGHSEAAKTFLQWENSPGHNANMLGSNYHAIGIGRVYGTYSTYGWYWTTDFGGVIDGPQCQV